MKKYLSTILALFFCLNNLVIAQISTKQAPHSFYNKSITNEMAIVEMPSINLTQLLEEDELEREQDVPWRFGKDMDVNLNLSNSGTWTTLSNGSRIWRLKINSIGAYSINLIYNEFFIPEGATFHLYNSSKTHVIGGFTSRNNKSNRKFATGLVKGESCILEYFEPTNQTGNGIINVSKVIHAYKNILDFGSSGSCNNNVNCPVGKNWEDEKRSVAMVLLSSNTRWCSGALVNNVNKDTTPFFLTANHCSMGNSNAGDIENWIFMFNYESPNCTNADGMTDQTISGCTVRAKKADTDFLLVELSSKPPESYNAYYAGWTRENTSSINSVGIHHPSGDIKKISFDYNPPLSSRINTTHPTNSHWKIQAWNDGTTEGGSSGSPLFDQNSRIAGQLHGGRASCTNITSDFYGKFPMSWNRGSSSSSRLRDWLDPNNTGTTV